MDKDLQNVLEQLSSSQEMQAKALQVLAGNKDVVTKDAVGAWSFTQLHGIGGLFSGAGVERDVVSARITPRGLGALLRRLPTVYEDPRFSAVTGFTTPTGTRPTNACDDATRGHLKSCELTALFGLNRQDSQEIEINKVMLRANRGDHTDLRLRGEVLGLTGFRPGGLNQQQILNIVTMSEMVKMGAYLEMEMSTDLWTGNPAIGAFPGLDRQIATGQLDARTGNACPALDSDVKDFDYDDVCGTGRDIVTYLSMLEFYLKHNASRMGLSPVQWVLVMRPELWFELSACWPCRYMTHRCATDTGTNPMVINDENNVTMRDAMRNGAYIDINGNRYPVIVDDGINELTNINDANLNPGQYASNIYMVPLVINGGMPVTYLEYLDYRETQTDTALLQGTEEYWWTDNGLHLWGISDIKGWCYQLHLKTEQRVVLRTPQLAGRIDNVMYEPLQHLRSPYYDSPYVYDGGASVIGGSTRYAVWLNSFPGGR